MTQRFVSGGAGNFTFDVANGLLDDVERLKGRAGGGDKGQSKAARAIMARLTAKLTNEEAGFDPTADWEETYQGNLGVEFFRWSAVEVRKGTTSHPDSLRWIATLRYDLPGRGINSQTFGTPPSGIAIKLAGYSQVGDLVALQPFPTYGSIANERFFGFYGASDPVATGALGLLRIEDFEPYSTDEWTYTVKAVRYRASAGEFLLETIEGTEGIAVNLFEANRYGQPMSHERGYIEVSGPIPTGSVVLGTRQARSITGTIFYAFMAPNGFRSVCVSSAQQELQNPNADRMLRDGL